MLLHQSDCSEKRITLINNHREPAGRFLGANLRLLATNLKLCEICPDLLLQLTKHNNTVPINATACVLPGTIRRDPSGVKVMRRKKEERASSIHIRNCFVPPLCKETKLNSYTCSLFPGSWIFPPSNTRAWE